MGCVCTHWHSFIPSTAVYFLCFKRRAIKINFAVDDNGGICF